MDKYKIAIFDHVGSKSGMDCYDDSLINALNKKGCETFIFSNYISNSNTKTKYNNVYEGFSKKNRLIRLFKFIRATIISSLTSKRNNVDLVLLHIFSAGIVEFLLTLIPKLFNFKIAVISHDVTGFKNHDNRFFQYLIYNILADFVIVHNSYSYDYMLKTVKIKNIDNLHIIKHGGYLDHIKNVDKYKTINEFGFDPSKKYILFFGQIKEVKGLDILLKALPKMRQDIVLIIAGKPVNDDFSYYEKIITDNKLNNRIVKIIRFIEDNERDRLFSVSDMIIIPYKKIYQSGVILMAMSNGLPVLASNLPGNTQLILHEHNGFLFKSENVNDLSLKINKYVNNQLLLKKISATAIQTIENDFSWDDIASEYLQLLKSKL